MQERASVIERAGEPGLDMTERATLREKAIERLMFELKQGEDSVRSEADWISEKEVLKRFGVSL